MFLQALLLPNPIQRSFLQMQEDIVKGCKAKCVERANESKYQNSGPFFSQGENGPDIFQGFWGFREEKNPCFFFFFRGFSCFFFAKNKGWRVRGFRCPSRKIACKNGVKMK